MKLFNTMSMQKEEFVPIEPGKVRMYACGPTVYNFIHVGNARPIIMFDVLRRYLEYRGYEVTFVQNFTDVDDKIIKRANEEASRARKSRKNTSPNTSPTPTRSASARRPCTRRPPKTFSRSSTSSQRSSIRATPMRSTATCTTAR